MPDPDAELPRNSFSEVVVEAHPVGLDADVDRASGVHFAPDGTDDVADEIRPASSGSPPWRMTSTSVSPWVEACSPMRRATFFAIALGHPPGLDFRQFWSAISYT